MNLLLLSNSSSPGQSFLGWAQSLITQFLPPEYRQGLFIPFAAVTLSWDDYTERVNSVWPGPPLTALHRLSDPTAALRTADLLVVGGGNTFQLVAECYRRDLMQPIQAQVRTGLPYLGWSAGANLATPSLGTTNDMPIAEPPSFRCLNLVPYQINPHFTHRVIPCHGGESRIDRLNEYTAVHPEQAVLALPEGSGIRVTASRHCLVGKKSAYLFRHHHSEPLNPPESSDFLSIIQA